MSSPVEGQQQQPPKEELTEKELAKLEKKRAKEEAKRQKEEAKAARLAEEKRRLEGPDVPYSEVVTGDQKFGHTFIQSQVKSLGRKFTKVTHLDATMKDQKVWIRARCQNTRKQGGKLSFVTLRQGLGTVQVVVFGGDIAKFAGNLSKESVVDLYGTVTVPEEPIRSTTQSEVELQAERIFCISRAQALPLQFEDLERTEADVEAGEGARVSLDTRLDNRVIDLRTKANQAILRVQSGVSMLFREFLIQKGLVEIHTPKLLGAASEGGADVFKVQYFERNAYLAQSPQLYKQMALMTDLPGVFEIGPVFRAEKSLTFRHMTEFVGLDMEMRFADNYHEVLDVIDGTFDHIFHGLNERFSSELEAIRAQYPFEDLIWTKPCNRFTFAQAMGILKKEGPAYLERDIAHYEKLGETKRVEEIKEHLATVVKHEEDEDIGTSDEKLLGRIMHDLYNTDFYIIDKFPASVRPFYTMPDPVDPKWTNSYDIFIRGEEVTSGAQRIHDADMLAEKAQRLGVELSTIQPYVDAFKYGSYPHAGAGVGLERVVMLFLGLPNIRLVSMFPRDPKRLTP